MAARAALTAVLMLALAACDEFPKDPRNTTETVKSEGVMQVGVIAGEPEDLTTRMDEAVRAIAAAHGVRADVTTGSADRLLREVEKGDLDLVVGAFPKSSPWKKRVAFTIFYPRKPDSEDQLAVRGAVRKGENRWLLSADRALQDLKP